MVRKVCLDSDVMIEILKNNKETITAVSSLPAFLYTTSINVFELWGGRKKSETILNFLEWYNLLDFDKNSALIAGDIRKKLKEKGLPIDIRDIFIGAICIRHDVELFTYNTKHFERLKKFGLKLVNL